MKPLRSTACDGSFLSDRPLLLLDTSMVVIRWMYQLIASGNTNIQSSGGIKLPTELWIQIFDLAADSITHSFCFVQASQVLSEPSRTPTSQGGQSTSTSQVLRCMRTEFDPTEFVENETTVYEVERYMRAPGQHTGDDLSHSQLSGPENTFYVKVDSRKGRFECLYYDIEVPDIISRIEGGRCWACSSSRSICPGCGGVGREYGVFMGCGVSLACPLCMGLDTAEYHKSFLQVYYWDKPPKDEAKEMEESLDQRLKELGYPPGAFANASSSSDSSDSEAE